MLMWLLCLSDVSSVVICGVVSVVLLFLWLYVRVLSVILLICRVMCVGKVVFLYCLSISLVLMGWFGLVVWVSSIDMGVLFFLLLFW